MSAAADSQFSGDSRLRTLDATMKRHRHQPDALIEVLHTAQELFGYLDVDCLKYVSRSLKVPPSRVYGVATFYNLFSLAPRGAHTCIVCTGTACYVKGSGPILDTIERTHRLAPGCTTPDGQLTLVTAHCLGTCGLAPVVVVDAAMNGFMTPDSALSRIEAVTGHDR